MKTPLNKIKIKPFHVTFTKLIYFFPIRKIKEGKTEEYYVLPGGGLEGNETPEENVTRELKEELTVDIEILG